MTNTIQNQRKPDKEGIMPDIYKIRQDKLIKTPRTMFLSMEKKLKTNQGKQRNKTVTYSTQSIRSPVNLKGLRELRTFLLTGVTSKTLYSSS